MAWLTLEHVLSLAIQDDGPRLERLASEELGEGQRDRIRRAWDDRLRLSLLSLLLVLVLVLLPLLPLLLLLLLHLLLHPRLLLDGFPLQLLDELGHGHAGLLGVNGELALHRSDLLRGGHLARWGHGHLPGLRGVLHCDSVLQSQIFVYACAGRLEIAMGWIWKVNTLRGPALCGCVVALALALHFG